MKKSSLVFLALFTALHAKARDSVQLLETVSAYPAPERSRPLEFPLATLPTRLTSAFGAMQAGVKVLPRGSNSKAILFPACSPSRKPNTLACFNVSTGEALDELPVPGAISTVPLYVENGWLFGTAKGIFVRTQGLSENSTMVLGGPHVDFWGAFARQKTEKLRPQVKYEGNVGVPKQGGNSPIGWIWHHTSASEFVGKPVLLDNFVFVLSANQFLHALDYNSGRLVWAYRLAPESSLRITSPSLAVSSTEVIVGTSEGMVTAINPKSGAVNWKAQIPNNGDRFPAVVAPALVLGKNIIVSNAESTTQKLSLDTRALVWTFPIGSVAQAQSDGKAVYVGNTSGTVVAIDEKTGASLWKTVLSSSVTVGSLFLTKGGFLVVALKDGSVHLIQTADGKKLQSLPPVGESVGEFFQGPRENQACMTFTAGGFRCYTVAIDGSDYLN